MKTFRPWDVDQDWLLPPSLGEFVPADHIAHFIRDLVRNELDLTPILSSYDDDRGYPPYHPGMMVALLLYAYTQSVYSSRRISRCCEERLDFMALTAMNRPDFRTISDFRKRHLSTLADLFLQVLRLCRAAGLVSLGHVAVDGTKLKANASRHKAMSYARMRQSETKLASQIASWFEMAEHHDGVDDAEHGSCRGDEMPAWIKTKQERLDRIRMAKTVLEEEARRDAGWSTLTDLDHLLECGLMGDPIARSTENHPREHSATSPIQTAVYCPHEMDLLRGTMVSSRLMPKDKSLSRIA
jgi:transposase